MRVYLDSRFSDVRAVAKKWVSVLHRYTAAAIVGLLTLTGVTTPTDAASAVGTAVIDGVVRAPDGVSVPDAPTRVTIVNSGVSVNESQLTDPITGAFSFVGLPSGLYSLWVEYTGASNIVAKIGWDGSLNQGPSFAVGDGEHRTFNTTLVAGASVTGTLLGQGGVLIPTPQVTLYSANSTYTKSATVDPTTGDFAISGVPPGMYWVQGSSTSPEWDYVRWTDPLGSSTFSLTQGGAKSGIVITLLRSASIRGTVLVDDGSTVAPYSGYVTFTPASGGSARLVFSEAGTGQYAVYGLDPGAYTVCFGQSSTLVLASCYGGADPATATPITVAAHQVVEGIDGIVTLAGTLSGRVLVVMTEGGTASSIPNARLRMYRWEDSLGRWTLEREAWPDSNGGVYSAESLPPGDYILQAVDLDGAFGSRYWRDSTYFVESDVVQLHGGESIDLGDIILRPRTLDVSRIAGSDRFEVGVRVSRVLYPDDLVPATGVPVVYVANGYNFPDALTAGPAAALQGGSVLLVEPTSIPPLVVAELTRLRPQRIVVAGGPASVSPEVFEQLKRFVASPSQVFRAGGEDRYAASRTVVRDAFEPTGATMAIITTGANFPDALSAGPAAASQSGPVILVDGSAASIDGATRQLIWDLGITRVYIAGGTGSVSPGIESSLRALLGAGAVTRFAGSDRFEVAILLSKQFFARAEYTFVATGYKFPDALTGGPLAAALGSPLYLSPPECLPVEVAIDILDLEAQAVVLLGGPGSLSPPVENLQLC